MSVISRLKLIAKLRRKEYRDAYVEEKVTTSLPFQIRALREQRGWSQAELGNRAEMRQNAISRLEDAENGPPSITTLLRLARAYDVALLVKFVSFSKLLDEFKDLSTKALEVASFEAEAASLNEAAIPATATANAAFVTESNPGPISEGVIGSTGLEAVSLTSRNPAFFILQDSIMPTIIESAQIN